MNFRVMTRHRFAANGFPADVKAKAFCEHVVTSNCEIAEKIVDKLKRQRFTDENGRTRYRYGRRGVKMVREGALDDAIADIEAGRGVEHELIREDVTGLTQNDPGR